jgi:hypothetical protein
MDLDGNGDVSAVNELDRCGSGQIYNPITDLPGPATGLRCPLGRTACIKPELNICDIDGSECGEFEASCTRPLSCQATTWAEDKGVGSITFVPATPEQYYCDLNNITYSTMAAAVAGCQTTTTETTYGTITFVPVGATTYFCALNNTTYNTLAAATAGCVEITSTTSPSPYNYVAATPTSYYCAANNTSYSTLTAATAGCVTTSTVQQPGTIVDIGGVEPRWRCLETGFVSVNYTIMVSQCVISVEVQTQNPVTTIPATSAHYYCPVNNTNYTTEAAAIAGCVVTSTTTTPGAITTIPAGPSGYFCDLNNVTYSTEAAAIAGCQTTGPVVTNGNITIIPAHSEGYFCAQNNTTYPTEALAIGSCRIIANVNGFDCPTTPINDKFTNKADCEAACNQTSACNIEVGPLQCPLGNYDCINEADGSEEYYCSPNACGTYETDGVYSPVDRSPVPNDGEMTADGCIDQIQIFSGNAESCRLPGAASAYQNCCQQADEDLLSDSQGSVGEAVLWAAGLNAVYDAAAAAYTAYSAAAASGAGVGTAASSSASVFQSTLIEGLSSTTVIVAVAIVAITAYLENACPPEGVLTAIKKKANHCVLLGEKCTTSILGSCVQKAEVHCCFNSVMAKLVQVGGRAQLGMDFGTVENPNCRGFTPEEFQSIDFSKIDLSAYYSELKARAQGEIENDITTVINNAANGI